MAAIDEFLNGRDTISTKDTILSIKINGNIVKTIECDKFTARLEKNKEGAQTLGSHWKKKKTTSVEGTGTLGDYSIGSNWFKYGIPYIQDGGDLYFDATLTIYDPTSRADKQVVQLTDVNLDDIPIVDFEADDGVMEWESDFIFEGVNLVQEFNGIN